MKVLYLTKKKKTKKAVAVVEKVEGRKIADQLEKNKSAAFTCLFGIARQSKKNCKNIVGMLCILNKYKSEYIKYKSKDGSMEGV